MSSLWEGVYDKMRSIKFRQFVYGRFHYWGFLEKDSFTGPINPRDPSQQFTGLFSKSGKEIYEGDILLLSMEGQDGRPFAIKWDINCFNVPRISWTYIIIGNIYENPELLGEL